MDGNPVNGTDTDGRKFKGTIKGMIKLRKFKAQLDLRALNLEIEIKKAAANGNTQRLLDLQKLQEENNKSLAAYDKLKKSKTVFYITHKMRKIGSHAISFDAKKDLKRNKKRKRIVLMYDEEQTEGGEIAGLLKIGDLYLEGDVSFKGKKEKRYSESYLENTMDDEKNFDGGLTDQVDLRQILKSKEYFEIKVNSQNLDEQLHEIDEDISEIVDASKLPSQHINLDTKLKAIDWEPKFGSQDYTKPTEDIDGRTIETMRDYYNEIERLDSNSKSEISINTQNYNDPEK